MADLVVGTSRSREPGIPLSRLGGLPSPIGPIDAATGIKRRQPQQLQPKTEDQFDKLIQVANVSPSLAAVLRPQAAYRWLLPYLAAITPTYVESVLRGALAGNHVQAWELFDLMVDTDPEIGACVEEYCDGVMAHKVHFEPWHEDDDEPSDLALEKCKLVSSALRNMRPDPANDENALSGTIRDLLFARFHGQSVVEIDWFDTYGTGKPNYRKVPGQDQAALFPRATFWVHPVCYAYSVQGRLGLRAAIADLQDKGTQYGPANQLRRSVVEDKMSLVEPPAWNWIASQPRPSMLVDFPKNKFLISTFKSKAGTALGQSCLRRLAWWWVASNFCGDWLLNYAQLFGIPFRKASFAPGTSEPVKAEIRQMLQSCGSCGYILLPDSAELEFMESGQTAGQSPQAFLFHFADSQKRKVILHQTMTGGQHDSMGKGGGKAFGEVEADTKGECIEAGARFAAEQVNLQLIPMLLELNYGPDGGDQEAPECKLVDSEVGGLADAQRDQVLSAMMNIPATYLRRKYGVPNPGPDDEVAGVDQGTQGAQMDQQNQQFKATQKAQADQADAQRQHAQALAKTAAAAPKAGQEKQPGQQEKQPGSDDNQSMDARAAQLKAADATTGKGCLMAMVPEDQAKRFSSWAREKLEKGSGVASAFGNDSAGDGVEDEPHVTVYYGFNLGFDTSRLAKLLRRRVPLTVTLGKVTRFECPEYDVLKVDADSCDLEVLNKTIGERFADDVTPSQHEFHPHLTLAYVAKGSNKGLDGSTDFQGEQFRVGSLMFSEPEHTNRQTFTLEARNALQARRIPIHFHSKADVAQALHETVEPLIARLEAIAKVDDEQARAGLMRKLLKDLPHLTAAMLHDDSVAKAFAPEAVRRFVEKLKEEKGKS